MRASTRRQSSSEADTDAPIGAAALAEAQKVLTDWFNLDWKRLDRMRAKIQKLKQSPAWLDRELAEVLDLYTLEELQKVRLVEGALRGRKRGQREFNDDEAVAEYIRRTDAGQPPSEVSRNIARRMKGRMGASLESKERRLRRRVAKKRRG